MLGEIVVVDAGSADGTLELLRAHGSLRLVEAPGATPGRGRNEGIRAATARIVVTLDAGSRVGPDFVAALGRAAAEGPVAVGVSEPDARTAFERAAGWFTLRAFKPAEHSGPIAGRAPAGRAQRSLLHARDVGGRGRLSPRPSLGRGQGLPTRSPCCGSRDRRRAGGRRPLAPPRLAAGGLPPVPQLRRGDALARVDRQNELVTFAVYGAGAALAVFFALGSRTAGALLLARCGRLPRAVHLAARRSLGWDAALAWDPPLRLVVDVAKMQGFLEGLFFGGRFRR